MGQTSSLCSYRPRTDPDRPKDEVLLLATYWTGLFEPEPKLYVDFDDEESLLRELKRFDIAGVIVSSRSVGYNALFLVDEDEDILKTSILDRGIGACVAVYSERYNGEAQWCVNRALAHWRSGNLEKQSQGKIGHPKLKDIPSRETEITKGSPHETSGKSSKPLKLELLEIYDEWVFC
ncbi:hypothetical protein TWF696_007392 [Orbilia brochopaga]|uniref:Uncharacterized protein n=1 Tax=Orbilia brochopaga TaxID=3140254 RepID=A0AAV9URS6_9PEZI